MTTPAGWYDDGSGRQRWWDGQQWTEHFAPVVDAPGTSEAAVDVEPLSERPSDAAAAETRDAIDSVAAVEAGATWDASASAAAPGSTDSQETEPQNGEPAAEAQPADAWTADPTTAADSSASADVSSEALAAPGPVPPYVNAAPETPAYAAPSYAAPGYPSTDSPYPGAATGYGAPGAYPVSTPAAPSTPAGLSVLGLIGLGLAALGTILACIPLSWIAVIGWLMLIAGFVVSVISLFLKGKKWPGITGLIVSVVGGIVAAIITVVIGIFATIATVSEEIRDLPTAPPSSESVPTPSTAPEDGPSTEQVEEGTIGDTVTLRFLGGTGEVTVTDATWSTDDGSGSPAANGGFLTVETTWTGIDGVTPANPILTSLEAADGSEGQIDFAVTTTPNELLDPGQTTSGPISFDIAESESYVFVITDEAAREIARISIIPTAG